MGRCTVVVFMLLFVCNMYGQQRFLSNHPRLLFTGAEEAAVKQLIQKSGTVLPGFLLLTRIRIMIFQNPSAIMWSSWGRLLII